MAGPPSGMTAAWLVPLLAMAFVAYKWPSAAVWVLGVALVLLAGTYGWYSLGTTSGGVS